MVYARYVFVTTFTVLCLLLVAHKNSQHVQNYVAKKYADTIRPPTPAVVPQNPCPNALRSQIEILKQEFGRLLAGINQVAMVGFPNHQNKGDSAIWSGEMELLKQLDVKVIFAFSEQPDYNASSMREALQKTPLNETAIMFSGGGNFGDLYHWHQTMREQVAADFKDFKIVSFPQSYLYYDQEKMAQTQRIYAEHPDLQLTARDTKSFVAMHRDFGDKHEVILTPDVATMLFGIPIDVECAPTSTFFFLARADHESEQDHRNKPEFEELNGLIDQAGVAHETSIRNDDWLGKDPAGVREEPDFNEKSWMRVRDAKRFMTQGELLITDRLHPHILSTIWDIPHVLLEEGTYLKAKSYHETWLVDVCEWNARVTNNPREAVDAAKEWYLNDKKFPIPDVVVTPHDHIKHTVDDVEDSD